jgi:hypothetical protein
MGHVWSAESVFDLNEELTKYSGEHLLYEIMVLVDTEG